MEHYIASLIIGLLGAGHCLGMCGGITAALTFSIDKTDLARRLQIIFCYNLGRISSYALMGALAAVFGGFTEQLGFHYMRVVAGVLMILMALYISGIWKVLSLLERAGQHLWAHIQPLSKGLLPVKSLPAAILLGAIWGWLPCGLVYTALLFSATSESISGGAVSMLLFGLGTMPAVVTGGLLADSVKSLLTGPGFRFLMAVLMLGFGVWTLVFAGGHNGHQHGHNQNEPAMLHMH